MGQDLTHSFRGTGRSEHLPEGLGPDGMPERWIEYEAMVCVRCGRSGLGLRHFGHDGYGRAEDFCLDPDPGEPPNGALPAACDPDEAAVFSVMRS